MQTPPPPLLITIDLAVPPGVATRAAREMLNRAYEVRRDNVRFDTSPLPGEPVDADWGVAGQILEAALFQLNEGLPNGSRKRVELALGALVIAQNLLLKSLERRGVMPAAIAMEPGQEQPK